MIYLVRLLMWCYNNIFRGVKIVTISLLSVQVKNNLPILPDLHGLPTRNVRKQVERKAMAVVVKQVMKST